MVTDTRKVSLAGMRAVELGDPTNLTFLFTQKKCWMMLIEIKLRSTSSNIMHHRATWWPNACNILHGLYSTMLEDVASTCWNRLARPSGNEGFINIKPLLGTFHKFKVIVARSFKTVVDMGS